MNSLLPGYSIRRGSTLERALLVKFMHRTYQEIFPIQDFSHLARTVDQYLNSETPLWWVEEEDWEIGRWGARGPHEGASALGSQRVAERSCKEGFPPGKLREVPSVVATGVGSADLKQLALGLGGNRENITRSPTPVACLWVGNAIDQVRGDRHAHIFLLYVVPEYRRQGIGTALMRYIEDWARTRGDRQIGLQVFESNTPALNLYNQLGYQTQSLWMMKSLHSTK